MTSSEPYKEHPEELLHRARAGLPLSARERLIRSEHLRACDVCRLLEETRVNLLDEAARPESGKTAAGKSLTELVAATMASFEAEDARRPAPSSTLAGRRRHERHPARMAALAAVAVCAVAGVALAARSIVETRAAPHEVEVSGPPLAARSARTGIRPLGAPAVAPVGTPIVDQTAEVMALGVEPVMPSQGLPSHAPSGAPPDASAAALFARATAARRAGRADEARHAYDRLWQDFPGTVEAQTGRVAFGRWLLDRNEAPLAARAFADYLRSEPHGTLAAEAGVGLAEALELLGDRPGARQAWSKLLANPAAGPFASHARARIRSLDARVRQSAGAGVQAP